MAYTSFSPQYMREIQYMFLTGVYKFNRKTIIITQTVINKNFISYIWSIKKNKSDKFLLHQLV